MTKIITLLVALSMTWGLVATLGWMSIAACFLLALGTLMFSTGEAEEEITGRQRAPAYFDTPSTSFGGL